MLSVKSGGSGSPSEVKCGTFSGDDQLNHCNILCSLLVFGLSRFILYDEMVYD